jgi:ABC-type transport system involved in multi-copper enzyme maturation permease subunit
MGGQAPNGAKQPTMQEKTVHLNFISKVLDNPIIAKEFKGRMRGKQGFLLLTAYLLLVSLVVVGVYLYSMDGMNDSRIDPNALQELGKQIFNMVVLFEFLLIIFIGPALTSGAISSERERQTFDLLRASLLSSRALVLGKLGTAVAYLLLLIFAALPLQSLAFFLGGVGLAEMVISLVMLATSTFLFCTLGIYFSGIAKRTVVATVMSYASLIFPVVILGGFYFLLENGDIDISSKSAETEYLILLFIWTILSTNPFTAAFLTEMMLTEEQILFIFYIPDFPYPLFSPWILYIAFSVIMTLLMIWLIVFYINRYER